MLKGAARESVGMYEFTWEGIERNLALLVEQAQERLLEEEQLIVGWDK